MKNLHSKVSYDLILKPLSFYEKRFGRVWEVPTTEQRLNLTEVNFYKKRNQKHKCQGPLPRLSEFSS